MKREARKRRVAAGEQLSAAATDQSRAGRKRRKASYEEDERLERVAALGGSVVVSFGRGHGAYVMDYVDYGEDTFEAVARPKNPKNKEDDEGVLYLSTEPEGHFDLRGYSSVRVCSTQEVDLINKARWAALEKRRRQVEAAKVPSVVFVPKVDGVPGYEAARVEPGDSEATRTLKCAGGRVLENVTFPDPRVLGHGRPVSLDGTLVLDVRGFGDDLRLADLLATISKPLGFVDEEGNLRVALMTGGAGFKVLEGEYLEALEAPRGLVISVDNDADDYVKSSSRNLDLPMIHLIGDLKQLAHAQPGVVFRSIWFSPSCSPYCKVLHLGDAAAANRGEAPSVTRVASVVTAEATCQWIHKFAGHLLKAQPAVRLAFENPENDGPQYDQFRAMTTLFPRVVKTSGAAYDHHINIWKNDRKKKVLVKHVLVIRSNFKLRLKAWDDYKGKTEPLIGGLAKLAIAYPKAMARDIARSLLADLPVDATQ